MLKAIAKSLLDFLFPPRCAGCRAVTEAPAPWCERCLRQIVAVRALPLPGPALCSLRSVHALCRYEGGVKASLHALKFHDKPQRAQALTFLLEQFAPEEALRGVQAIVPAPLSERRERARGYNQTERIFRPWAKRRALPWHDALVRTRETVPQYGLSRAERRANVKGAFALADGAAFRGETVLLVDDIFTTGATLLACAEILKRAGAKEVRGLVLASGA